MKRRTEKRDEPVMRFFTPELFMRFNSADDDKADVANEQWEKALIQYREHLDQIQARIPHEAKELIKLCLHDAELLSPEQALDPLFSIRLEPFAPDVFLGITILPLKLDGKLISLIYLLSDRIREHAPVRNWRFSKLRTHWLYDEIDVDPSRRTHFLHRVLLSDGRVLEIPFISAMVRHISLSPPTDELARASA